MGGYKQTAFPQTLIIDMGKEVSLRQWRFFTAFPNYTAKRVRLQRWDTLNDTSTWTDIPSSSIDIARVADAHGSAGGASQEFPPGEGCGQRFRVVVESQWRDYPDEYGSQGFQLYIRDVQFRF
jgi:hypothetical protein